ncbi:MAG: rhodanese-like domain-containing protein [Luteolibacter sp.]
MKTTVLFCSLPLIVSALADEPPNPLIDYRGFVMTSTGLGKVHEERRVSEEKFIAMAAEPGTVILDARSTDKFQNIHIKGALHLPFTDFTEDALKKIIPDKTTRILIYCNNNFKNEPANFASKSATVSLNIQTFINLHTYGYENVYELAPLLDVKTTKIQFEGSIVK